MKNRTIAVLLTTVLTLYGCISVEPVAIRSIQCCTVKKTRGSEPAVTFLLEVENPNDFDITIKKYDVGVRINGNTVGSTSNTDQSILKAHSVLKKEVEVTTSLQQLVSGSLLMGLTSLLQKDPTTLQAEIIGSVVAKAKGVRKRVRIKEKYPLQMHP